MEEVYNVVRQEEDMRTSNKLEEERSLNAVSAFVAQAKGRGRGDDQNRSSFCRHCNRSGHSTDSCFAVIGYPEWWGDRPRARSVQGRPRGGSSYAARTCMRSLHRLLDLNQLSRPITSSLIKTEMA